MKPGIKLGQEVFVLSPSRDIVRTQVALVRDNGGYQFLNGDTDKTPHWFNYASALAVARAAIDQQTEALQDRIESLGREREERGTERYKERVLRAPYNIVNLGKESGLGRRGRTKKRRRVTAPLVYYDAGSLVYTVITKDTKAPPDVSVYRPHETFVLEILVEAVWFTPDGVPHYQLSTSFEVDTLYLSRREALTSAPGSVPFVSHAEEDRELTHLNDADVPF